MSNPVEHERRREMVVGAFAFAIVLGLFCFSIFVTGDTFWKSKKELTVQFRDVMGLKRGDNVIVRGMIVGDVSRLEYDGDKGYVRVVCSLNQKIQIREDYHITVVPTSILGGRLLRITEGMQGAPVPLKTLFRGDRPDDLVGDAGQVVSSVRKILEEGGLLADLQATVKQARAVVEKINNGQGTVGKLINDETVYTDLQASAESLKKVAQRLESGEGFLGKMLSEDEGLYDDTKLMIQDVRAAVDDFRETSPLLTFTSVMFGAF